MINTPQTKLVYETIQNLGHATNHELHQEVSKTMPDLSVTTVHRITKRLVEENKVQCTLRSDGVNVVDARTDPHSHFSCQSCGGLVDLDVPSPLLDKVQEQLGNNIAGSITILGSCEACVINNSKVN